MTKRPAASEDGCVRARMSTDAVFQETRRRSFPDPVTGLSAIRPQVADWHQIQRRQLAASSSAAHSAGDVQADDLAEYGAIDLMTASTAGNLRHGRDPWDV